jgi:hypothetical protein
MGNWAGGRERTAENMRGSLYARVSTADKSRDPEMQLRELRDYCKRRDWTVTGEYVDRGISGSKDSRPEWNSESQTPIFDGVILILSTIELYIIRMTMEKIRTCLSDDLRLQSISTPSQNKYLRLSSWLNRTTSSKLIRAVLCG